MFNKGFSKNDYTKLHSDYKKNIDCADVDLEFHGSANWNDETNYLRVKIRNDDKMVTLHYYNLKKTTLKEIETDIDYNLNLLGLARLL